MNVAIFPVDLLLAKRMITELHYSHAMPSTFNCRSWGLYDLATAKLLCVITTSAPTNTHGLANKFGLERWPGNVEISRIVAAPDAPRNTVSCALSLVCTREHEIRCIDWLFSYSDTTQNHHGGVYQAVNSVYVGMSGGRMGYTMDGKPIHPRSLVQQYGTHEWPLIKYLVAPRVLKQVRLGAKHTYILPIGPRRKAIRRHLQRYALPYPKRDDASHQFEHAVALA